MIKKFLLTIGTLLFLTTAAYSVPLQFSHASVFLECSDQNSARHLAEVVQKRQPLRYDMGSCQLVNNFGAKINSMFVNSLVIDSPIMEDWEGDKFAIYTILFKDTTYWLFVYNPHNLYRQADMLYN